MNQHNLWCFVNRKKIVKRLRGRNLPHRPCYRASDRLAISWWYPQPFFWAPEPLCCLWRPKRMLTFCAESSEKHPWFSVKKQRLREGKKRRLERKPRQGYGCNAVRLSRVRILWTWLILFFSKKFQILVKVFREMINKLINAKVITRCCRCCWFTADFRVSLSIESTRLLYCNVFYCHQSFW